MTYDCKFSKQAELDFLHNFRHETEGERWAKHEIETLRQQLATIQKREVMLRDALRHLWNERTPDSLDEAGEALAATEPITNYGDWPTRRRNADDMGNPPANAAESLNAWKPKP